MAPFSFLSFIKTQFLQLPEVENVDLTGRTIIVVGSNVGLGLEAARHFANMKARTILAVRSTDKGEQAKADIKSTAPHANVEVWKLDLGDLQSVRQFAERVKKDLDRLDILALNAGVANNFWSTSNGYETTLMTNDIATGLAAVLLLPMLEKTATLPAPAGSPSLKPHIAITGSEVHFWAKFVESKEEHPIHALNDQSKFDGSDRYNCSKLLNIFIGREVGKLASDKVVVNVTNPGLCHSSLGRDGDLFSRSFLYVLRLALARTTEAGSRTIVWAALNDTPAGAYTSACRVEEESDFSLSKEGADAQRKVWNDLKQIWLEAAPEVKEILG